MARIWTKRMVNKNVGIGRNVSKGVRRKDGTKKEIDKKISPQKTVGAMSRGRGKLRMANLKTKPPTPGAKFARNGGPLITRKSKHGTVDKRTCETGGTTKLGPAKGHSLGK